MKIRLIVILLLISTLSLGMAQRGSAGHLNILYWQAASTLNPYLSGGTKDLEAASMILEPLARYDQDGNIVPWLVDEVPTVANGGVSEDLTSITWKLSEGLKWSDGSPVTSADVVFSADYCMDEASGCNSIQQFEGVASVEAIDDLTVKITFEVPKPFPYGPFVGMLTPIIQKAQFADCMGANAQNCTEANFAPIGTGPFVATDFRANDVVTYEANQNYRDPAKPAFATVTFKGGGDAASAARAVLETGEADYAWNLQVEPEILDGMAAAGKGTVITSFGANVERLMVNLTNPDPALGEYRSLQFAHGVPNPHPFLSDINVRKALSMAIDREILTEIGYGKAGKPSCNVLAGPAAYASTANDGCLVQDIEGANKLLDDAGWVKGPGGIREKNGVPLKILYQTSTNSVRQGTQALIKEWWKEIGVDTELRNIDAAVFFGGDPASPDTYGKFYADIEMYTNGFTGTDPEAYMAGWTCDSASDVSNDWLGNNIPRYCDFKYDELSKEFAGTAAFEDRVAIAKKMNDMLMANYIMIPLIHRGSVSAHANSLTGVIMTSWDSELWNVADWGRK